MPVEMLTYANLAERLKVSPEAARALAKRHRLPRSRANDGKTLVGVDFSEIQHKALPARPPRGDQAVIQSLKEKINTLQAEIARLEAVAAGHRADFERERDRADRLVGEMLKALGETMAAKEATAWLEGELAALRSRPEALQAGATAQRVDFERERDRAHQLVVEVLKASAEATEAKKAAAMLEGQLVALQTRPWWRRLAS